MELVIYDSEGVLSSHFSKWFLRIIKETLIQNIDKQKAKMWNEYLNSTTTFKSIYLKNIDAVSVLMIGINNIVLTRVQNKLIYHIDNNQYVPGLDRVKVIDICKLINYGTLSHPAYPLFTSVFTEMQQHFSEYVDVYLHTVG